MSDSVGKISLDLEVKSDLGKQISSMSGLIAKNLKTSLNAGTKTMFDGMKKSANDGVKSLDSGVKSTLKRMKNNLKNTMKSVFESMKEVKMPPIKFPKMGVMKPKNINIPKANTRRGPPEDIEKLKDMKIGKVQTLDITDRQIDNLRNKLKALNDQLDNTFNTKGRNKLEGTILSTEARMNSLIEKSIKLGAEITELDSKIMGTGTKSKGIGIASQNISKLGRNADGAKERIGRLSSSLTQLGFGAKRTSGHLGGTNSQLKMIIRSMVTWGMIFPLVIRGITAMATSLGQSLMTNQQFANSLAQIKSNLMVAFTPIFNAILPALNALMSALATATTYIASFISAIFGKTYQQSAQATKSLIGAKAAMGAYGNATEKAGKQAKKAQGSLMGFDEINSLNMDNGTDDADGGSGGGGGDDIPTLVAPPLDIAPVDSAMAELAQKVKKVFATIFQPFKNAWAKDGASVMAEVKRAVEATKDTFKNFYNVLATPPVQLFIENIARIGLSLIKLALSIYREFILPIINWFIDILPGAANGLNPILDAVRRFIDYLASNGELLRWICSLILGLVVAFKSFSIVSGIIGLIQGFIGVVQLVGAVVAGTVSLGVGGIAIIIAGIIGLIAMFVALYASSESFRNKVNEICSTIMEFLAPAFEFLKEKALDVWNNALVPFGAFLVDLWKTVLEPLAKIIGEILVIAFQAVMDIAKSLWENVLKPLASFIVDIFIKAIQGIIDIYNAWKPVIQAIIDIIKFLWNNVLKPFVKFIVDVFLSCFTNTFKAIGSLIDGLKKILSGVIDFIVGVFTGNWSRAWDGIKQIFSGVWDIITGILKAFDNFLNYIFTADWSKGFGVLGHILNGFFASVRQIWNGIKQVFTGIVNFISGVFTGNWSKAWTGVKQIFKGIWDTFVGIAKSPINMIVGLINGMISAINVAIRGINKLKWDVPDWVPLIGGQHWGFNISEIGSVPYLAKGGVIDSPTLAMVGEAGREAVVPLENNTGWKDEIGSMVANAVLSAMQFSGGSSNSNSNNGDIILQIDGTTFARVINPYAAKENQRLGNSMVIKTV